MSILRSFPRSTSEAKQQRRRELGLPADGLVVGYQGSFRNFHGIDLLCELVRATAGQPACTGCWWAMVRSGTSCWKRRREILQ